MKSPFEICAAIIRDVPNCSHCLHETECAERGYPSPRSFAFVARVIVFDLPKVLSFMKSTIAKDYECGIVLTNDTENEAGAICTLRVSYDSGYLKREERITAAIYRYVKAFRIPLYGDETGERILEKVLNAYVESIKERNK